MPDAHSCSVISTILTQLESVFHTLAALCAWLHPRALSQASTMNLAMLSQAALATSQHWADNQPLACVLTLHCVAWYTHNPGISKRKYPRQPPPPPPPPPERGMITPRHPTPPHPPDTHPAPPCGAPINPRRLRPLGWIGLLGRRLRRIGWPKLLGQRLRRLQHLGWPRLLKAAPPARTAWAAPAALWRTLVAWAAPPSPAAPWLTWVAWAAHWLAKVAWAVPPAPAVPWLAPVAWAAPARATSQKGPGINAWGSGASQKHVS